MSFTEETLFGDQMPTSLGAGLQVVTCLEDGVLVNAAAMSTHVNFHNRLQVEASPIARVTQATRVSGVDYPT